MSATDTLYSELKPDIGAIADRLFDVSESLLRKRGRRSDKARMKISNYGNHGSSRQKTEVAKS